MDFIEKGGGEAAGADNLSINYSVSGRSASGNESTLLQSLWYRHDVYVGTVLVVAYSLVFIAGLIGNFLVVFAVFSGGAGRTMRNSTTNVFLANLAIADLLVILACIPFTLVAHIIYPWVLGALICKLVPYFQGVSVCASVYSLVAVTVERCRSITSPLNQRLSTRSCRKIIALIWIAAALITLPWLVVFQQHSIGQDFMVCTEEWPEPWMEVAYFSVTHLTLCYVVPLLIIIVSYALVCHRIWRREIPGSQLSEEVERQTHQLHKSKLRALRVVAVVVVAFALAWLPLYATFLRLKLATSFTQFGISGELEADMLAVVIPIAQWMSSANSCINPFLYHFLDPRFRYRFRQMLLIRSSTTTTTTAGQRPTTTATARKMKGGRPSARNNNPIHLHGNSSSNQQQHQLHHQDDDPPPLLLVPTSSIIRLHPVVAAAVAAAADPIVSTPSPRSEQSSPMQHDHSSQNEWV